MPDIVGLLTWSESSTISGASTRGWLRGHDLVGAVTPARR
jgi:hypothetical protein